MSQFKKGQEFPKRILIVGHGSIGKRHLRLVRASMPNSDIRVLRHSISDELLEFADGCFYNIKDACAFSPQVSIVANPAPFHVEITVSLLAAGSHVLIEKPLSETVEQAYELSKAAVRYNRLLHVGYNLRFLDSLRQFRNSILSRELGSISSVHCEVGQYLPSWRPGMDYRLSVSAKKDLGGGVLLELSHELDYLRWIFGDIEWVCAYTARLSSLQIDVEDTAHLMLGFTQSQNAHHIFGTVNLDFIRHDKTRMCTAICDGGTLRWNGVTGEVQRLVRSQLEWDNLHQSLESRDKTYTLQWYHFLNCIRDNQLPAVPLQDGLYVMQVIDAARRSSSANGSRVMISSDVELTS